MRTYYIFSVNKEMSILTKDSPYMLFKSFESIFRFGKSDLDIASTLYYQLTCRLNKENLNNKIKTAFKDNDFYMYTPNNHDYYNKYRDESCHLNVKNNYLLFTCNSSKFNFLNNLRGFNFFACDFENKDYFWLDEIYC